MMDYMRKAAKPKTYVHLSTITRYIINLSSISDQTEISIVPKIFLIAQTLHVTTSIPLLIRDLEQSVQWVRPSE